ncbi:MAG: RNA polymerase sigma factor RpoH [Gammaproteobacteria bacterium]
MTNLSPTDSGTELIPAAKSALSPTDMLVPGNSIGAYLSTIRSIDILSNEEEKRLAKRFHKHQDTEAARMLILSHLRFVSHIAKSYMGYGLPYSDLIQEGNLGLIKAVQNFDPDIGVRLVSFAVHWIKSEIHEYVLKNWSIVKIATTKAQRKLFFNLRKYKKNLGLLTDSEVEAIALELNVKPAEVRQMEKRLSYPDVSTTATEWDSTDSDQQPALPQLPASSSTEPATIVETQMQNAHNQALLQRALRKLDDRSQDILKRRWLSADKISLKELAGEYQVSAERIRQIEANALKQIRHDILEHAG